VRWEEGGRNKGKRGWEPMVIPLLSLYRFQWPYVPCIYVHPITNIIGQKKSELHLPPQGFYSANFLNAGIVYMLTRVSSPSVVVIYKAILRENHPIIKIDGLDITITSGALELYNPPSKESSHLDTIFQPWAQIFCKCFFRCCRI
jgi:hypothetical protein